MIRAYLRKVVDALEVAAQRRGLGERDTWLTVQRALTADHPVKPNDSRPDASAPPDEVDTLARVGAVFVLSGAELDLLLIAAAADLDPTIALAYGVLQGADGHRPATVALAMELAGIPLLDGRGRLLLADTAPLRRWGLLHVGPGQLLLGRAITAGADLIGALLNHPIPEELSAAMTVPVAAMPRPVAEEAIRNHAVQQNQAVQTLAAGVANDAGLAWVETAPGGAGLETAIEAFEREELAYCVYDLGLRPSGAPLVSTIASLIRRSGLSASGMVLLGGEHLAIEPDVTAAMALLNLSPVPTVVVAHAPWNAAWHPLLPLVVRAEPVSLQSRLSLWRRYVTSDEVADSALASYRLTPRQIHSAGVHLTRTAKLSKHRPDPQMVSQAIRLLGGAKRLATGSAWGPTTFADLQVPAEARASLLRLADWVRLRDEVTGRGQVHGLGGKATGIAALFTGNPGTGKTLAAHVIADTVGLDLMQVDLSGVIDKYIGETEKNLERIFTEAENLNVVLFFDEADALFGTRSEVKDARDRYANQEVSYLLQRMEQFDGITILATNLRGNLDAAFARRMHFIVHFPDPDAPTRLALWQQLLARVGGTDPGDPVDFEMLAATVDLTGGALRNIVLAATYDAAIESGAVGQRHLVAAALREYSKLGRRPPVTLA